MSRLTADIGASGGVGPDVGGELARRLDQSVLSKVVSSRGVGVELALEVLDGVQGGEDVAVPETI